MTSDNDPQYENVSLFGDLDFGEPAKEKPEVTETKPKKPTAKKPAVKKSGGKKPTAKEVETEASAVIKAEAKKAGGKKPAAIKEDPKKSAAKKPAAKRSKPQEPDQSLLSLFDSPEDDSQFEELTSEESVGGSQFEELASEESVAEHVADAQPLLAEDNETREKLATEEPPRDETEQPQLLVGEELPEETLNEDDVESEKPAPLAPIIEEPRSVLFDEGEVIQPEIDTKKLYEAFDIPGQERATQAITQAILSNDYGHAWAFIGPEGVGQTRCSRLLAAYANAENGDPTPAELDQFLRSAHPAITTILPVKDYRKEDVQTWNEMLSFKLIQGSVRVIHVTKAHQLNDAAANAFLKALEEPPSRTVWILDIADSKIIPDTILSRCRIVRFNPWKREDLKAFIVKTNPSLPDNDIDLILSISEGTPGKAEQLCNPDALQEYKDSRMWLSTIMRESPGFALVATKQMADYAKRRSTGVEADKEEALEQSEALFGGDLSARRRKEITDRFDRLERAEKQQTIQDCLDANLTWIRDVLVAHSFREQGLSRKELMAQSGVFINQDLVEDIIEATSFAPAKALFEITKNIQRANARLVLNSAAELTVITNLIQGQTLARSYL